MKFRGLFLLIAIYLCLMPNTGYAQDNAASLYHSRCAMCHGVTGKADTPAGKAFKAVDYHDPAVMAMTDAELTAIITNGKEKMPAFGKRLSASDIAGLVAYIHVLQKK
ncbi:MAG TPA: cytochrome c [Acidobacteriaceae bacterium]|nr:cytochrome c [Acidobacteriaceae bacterium]